MSTDPAPIPFSTPSSLIPGFLRDVRVLKIIGQVIFAIILIAAVSSIWTSILSSLQSKNLTPNTVFLTNRAGFDISEHPDWYSSNSSYGDAFRVGLENSLRIIGIGLVLATVIGILGGIFLLSSNWLMRTITRAVVEILRNTPLLVQLIAWYFVVMLSLPLFQQAASLPQEGIVPLAARLVAYAVALVIVWVLTLRTSPTAPRRTLLWNGLIAAVIVLEAAFHWLAPGVYASARLDNIIFLIYAIVSLALIAASWLFAPSMIRWRLIGLSVGQFMGGLLFYFGLIPNSSFAKITVSPAVLLSNRGLVLPEILPTARFDVWLVFVVIGLVIGGSVVGLLGAFDRAHRSADPTCAVRPADYPGICAGRLGCREHCAAARDDFGDAERWHDRRDDYRGRQCSRSVHGRGFASLQSITAYLPSPSAKN